jgi:hypothetical protein
VLGSGGVNIASSTVNGIVLALNRSINVSGGAVNGELVGGSISLSGCQVNDPPPVVPEANTFLVLIPFGVDSFYWRAIAFRFLAISTNKGRQSGDREGRPLRKRREMTLIHVRHGCE